MSEQERFEMGAEEYAERIRDRISFRGPDSAPDFAYPTRGESE